MSSIISKGELSAFQRWEMTSFGDTRHTSHVEEAPLPPPVQLPTFSEAELEAIREDARQEGYSAGYQEAYERGLREGQEAGYASTEEHAQKELNALEQLTLNFAHEMQSAGKEMGESLLSLAIELAEAMLKAKFELDHDAIIPIVQDAIEQLPLAQQQAQILMHPDDALIIKDKIGTSLSNAGWRIVNDPHQERGGCKVETSHNLLDSSYETRWSHLTELLKKNLSKSD